MTHVFISYSRTDTAFVDRLDGDLRAQGVTTWRDVHSIPGGALWFRRIKAGLEASYAMLYVDTPDSELSEWVEKEFLYAAALRLPIIPVKLDERFRSLHTINLNPLLCDDARYTLSLGKLIARLAELPHEPIVRGATPPAPSAPTDTPAAAPDGRREVLDYLGWLLAKANADLRDALYVNLAATPEAARPSPPAASPLAFGLDMDLSLGFDRLALERLHGEAFDRRGDDVADARLPLAEMKRVILLGEPGAGKTTTLLQLAVDLARAAQAAPEAAPLPVFVPLRQFNGDDRFADFVQKQTYNLQDAFPNLQRAGRFVLLLDALNEMPRRSADGRDLTAEVRDYLRDQPHWAVSCRVRDYQEDLRDLDGVGKLRLKPLDPPGIYAVIQRRFARLYAPQNIARLADGEALWTAMKGSADLLDAWQRLEKAGKPETFWGKTKPDELGWFSAAYNAWRNMRDDRRRLLPLCRNPYMTKLVCDLYAVDKSLPDNRGALFKRFVDALLKRDREAAEAVNAAWLPDDLIRRGLAGLAYHMGGQTELARAEAEAILRAHLPGVDHALLLRLATGASLLDVGETARFTHQLLQEYFAGEVLGQDIDAGVDPARYWPPDRWWQPNERDETLIILAGVRGDPLGVARWVAPAQPELAERVLTESGVAVDLSQLDAATRAAILKGAQAKMHEPHPVGRAAAYRALGRLGADERRGVGCNPHPNLSAPSGQPHPNPSPPSGEGLHTRLTPPLHVMERGSGGEDASHVERGRGGEVDILWCEIAAGPFLYGPKEETRVIEQPYAIAKYPVTNAQYAPFIAAGGYGTRRWWTEAGWAAKEAEGWDGAA